MLFALWAVGAEPSSAAAVRAESSSVIITLYRGPETIELRSRLRAELAALGYRVREIDDPGRPWPDASVTHEPAFAAVRFATPTTVELWVETAQLGKAPILERVPLQSSTDRVGVVRAVEVLRAYLIKLGLRPTDPGSAGDGPEPADNARGTPPDDGAPRPMPDSANLPVAVEEPPTAPVVWRLGALAAALRSPSGGGFWPGGGGSLTVEPTPWLSVTVLGAIPFSATTAAGPEGHADLRFTFVGALAQWQQSRAAFGWAAGVGAAGLWLGMKGEATVPGYVGRSDQVFTTAAFVVPSVWLGSDPFRLRASAYLGSALPKAAVQFSGRTVATWGDPFFMMTLGLELDLSSLAQRN